MDEFTRQIINNIYEAALDPKSWHTVLSAIKQTTDAKHAVISFYDAHNRNRNSINTAGGTTEQERSYLDEYIDVDEQWLRKAFSAQAYKKTFRFEDFLIATGLTRTEILGEHETFFIGAEINKHVFSPLLMTPNVLSTFSLHRDISGPDFGKEEIAFVESLAPHLSRAIRIHDQLSIARHENDRLLKALKSIGVGVLLLDSELRVIFSNPEAARILTSHRALTIGRGGRLKTARSELQNRLEQILLKLSHGSMGDVGHTTDTTIALHHERHLHPLKLTAISLADMRRLPHLVSKQICVAVFLTDPERSWVVPKDYLQQAYALTPTEMVVAQSLLNGASIAQIAAQRGTSEETTRWQVKRLFDKTSTNSQAELVRLLAALSMDFALPN